MVNSLLFCEAIGTLVWTSDDFLSVCFKDGVDSSLLAHNGVHNQARTQTCLLGFLMYESEEFFLSFPCFQNLFN